MKPKLFVFILGFIVGLLVALVVPPLIESWLPPGLTGARSATTGEVVAKRLQEDRLLLTIESEDGAVLATFKEKVPEIDLLVEVGDRVTLGITRYEPFVEDPTILGVKKGPAEGAVPGLPEGPPEEGAPVGEILEGEPGEPAPGAGEGLSEEPTEASASAEETEGESPTLPPMGPAVQNEESEENEPQGPPPR